MAFRMLDQASQLVNGETHVVLTSTIERLGLAAALGGIIGLERELRHKAAGLRTNMLICFGSAVFTVLSAQMADRFGGDNVRIASQIIPGIGFIGAGAILRERGSVTGVTTAATFRGAAWEWRRGGFTLPLFSRGDFDCAGVLGEAGKAFRAETFDRQL